MLQIVQNFMRILKAGPEFGHVGVVHIGLERTVRYLAFAWMVAHPIENLVIVSKAFMAPIVKWKVRKILHKFLYGILYLDSKIKLSSHFILIIFDVTGSEEQVDSRKQLLAQFLQMYEIGMAETYFSLATNVEGGYKVNKTLIKQNFIDSTIASLAFSNETINLSQ